jgi:baseplate J-like protein
MALLGPSLDYSDRDFDSLRARLIALARSAFPAWTDFEVASFGTTLLELFAFVGDVVGYCQDNQAAESRLSTATQRKNVIALARMLGYKLHGAAAATADVILSAERVPGADVILPEGTVVRTPEKRDAIEFRLVAPVTIRAGQAPPEAPGIAEHAELREQRVDARGLPGLEVVLERTPYLDGSLQIDTPLGEYAEVETLLGSTPMDRHVTAAVDENDRATLRFGDGRQGLPPQGPVRIRYKTGGGDRGNVDPGQISVVEGNFSDAHGHSIQLRVRNPSKAAGGVDRQSVDRAKQLAPLSLRALNRSVAREDFELHATNVPGVARALLLTSNEDVAVPENSGDLVIVPTGGGPPTQPLLDEVLRQVTVVNPCTLTFQVRVLPAEYILVNVTTRVFLRPGARPSDVAEAIRSALSQRFAVADARGVPNPAIDFGARLRQEGELVGTLAWSDIAALVIDRSGVRKLDDGQQGLLLNGFPQDVELATRQFPVLGTVRIFRADTGDEL